MNTNSLKGGQGSGTNYALLNIEKPKPCYARSRVLLTFYKNKTVENHIYITVILYIISEYKSTY